jgi:hypothetical protein
MARIVVLVFERSEASSWAESGEDRAKIDGKEGEYDRCSNR